MGGLLRNNLRLLLKSILTNVRVLTADKKRLHYNELQQILMTFKHRKRGLNETVSVRNVPPKKHTHKGSSLEILQGGGVKGQLSQVNSPHPGSAR